MVITPQMDPSSKIKPNCALLQLFWRARIYQYFLGHKTDLWSFNFDTTNLAIAPDFQEIFLAIQPMDILPGQEVAAREFDDFLNGRLAAKIFKEPSRQFVLLPGTLLEIHSHLRYISRRLEKSAATNAKPVLMPAEAVELGIAQSGVGLDDMFSEVVNLAAHDPEFLRLNELLLAENFHLLDHFYPMSEIDKDLVQHLMDTFKETLDRKRPGLAPNNQRDALNLAWLTAAENARQGGRVPSAPRIVLMTHTGPVIATCQETPSWIRSGSALEPCILRVSEEISSLAPESPDLEKEKLDEAKEACNRIVEWCAPIIRSVTGGKCVTKLSNDVKVVLFWEGTLDEPGFWDAMVKAAIDPEIQKSVQILQDWLHNPLISAMEKDFSYARELTDVVTSSSPSEEEPTSHVPCQDFLNHLVNLVNSGISSYDELVHMPIDFFGVNWAKIEDIDLPSPSMQVKGLFTQSNELCLGIIFDGDRASAEWPTRMGLRSLVQLLSDGSKLRTISDGSDRYIATAYGIDGLVSDEGALPILVERLYGKCKPNTSILEVCIQIAQLSLHLQTAVENMFWHPQITIHVPKSKLVNTLKLLAPTTAWLIPTQVIEREIVAQLEDHSEPPHVQNSQQEVS